MDYRKIYEDWLKNPQLDEKTHEELASLSDEEEIRDRFYQPLSFGTAGLRGKLGAGTNRMNLYTVGEAAEGFARMIVSSGEEAMKKGVAIGYDVRHMSKEFAELSASIFTAHGIHVYLHKDIVPTPVLSYTIRKLGTYAGVMVTASHNPREYNGYKAYGTEGSQILDDWAHAIEKNIREIEDFSEIKKISLADASEAGLLDYIPDSLYDEYIQDVLSLTIHDDQVDKSVRIVYSPLNGCGNKLVRKILAIRGFHEVNVVQEEENPDPDFTTTGYPNPERPECFRLSEELGKKVHGEILLATDPDSDRTAMEVLGEDGEYHFLDGNKIGALLTHYVLSQRKALGTLPKNAAVVKSIVTGDIARPLCERYGAKLFEVLTGFKNIAAPVNEWDHTHEYTYVFGYEESIGFNAADFVRDKDAVSSAMLVAEMAGFYKKHGKNLLQALEDIYQEYGYYNNDQVAVTLEGADGQAQIGRIMEEFRNHPIQEIGSMKLDSIIDYERDDTGLPKSNVLKYRYDNGSWYAIRPSGTEPKIKLYLYSVGRTLEESKEILHQFEKVATDKMSSVE